jgi:hypothetical protein
MPSKLSRTGASSRVVGPEGVKHTQRPARPRIVQGYLEERFFFKVFLHQNVGRVLLKPVGRELQPHRKEPDMIAQARRHRRSASDRRITRGPDRQRLHRPTRMIDCV